MELFATPVHPTCLTGFWTHLWTVASNKIWRAALEETFLSKLTHKKRKRKLFNTITTSTTIFVKTKFSRKQLWKNFGDAHFGVGIDFHQNKTFRVFPTWGMGGSPPDSWQIAFLPANTRHANFDFNRCSILTECCFYLWKRFNGQAHSYSDSHCPTNNPPAKFSIPLTP